MFTSKDRFPKLTIHSNSYGTSYETAHSKERNPSGDIEYLPISLHETVPCNTMNSDPIHHIVLNRNSSHDDTLYKHQSRRSILLYSGFGTLILFSMSILIWIYRIQISTVQNPLLGSSSTFPTIKYDSSINIYSLYDSSSNSLLATGSYERDVNNSGWQYLRVLSSDLPKTKVSHDPVTSSNTLVEAYMDRMRALGHLEGYMTCKDISAWYINFYSGLFDGGDPTDEALDFLQTNYDWMKDLSEKHWSYSEHWLAVRGFLAQLEGLVAGQGQGCPGSEMTSSSSFSFSKSQSAFLPTLKRRPALIHFLLMNGLGDLYQIAEKFNQRNQPPSDILPDNYQYYPNPYDLGPDSDLDDDPSSISSQLFTPKSRRSYPIKPSFQSITSFSEREEQKEEQKEDENEEIRLTSRWAKDHCSAIVKLLPDKSDILFGHNTWDDYQLMGPRIFKYISSPLIAPHRDGDDYDHYIYHIQYDSSSSISSASSSNSMKQLHHEVYFTSSPGLLTSVDDFYTMSGRTNLAVTETSLDIYNKDLLNLIHPESLLSWMRALISNHLAVDGDTWAQLFSAYHSGTYANQWMILNFDRFSPGLDPKYGFLVVLEEVPGYVHYEDLTSHLILPGYWASYNNPFFDDIFILSGYLDLCISDSTLCHSTDPRAIIFRERQSHIVDIPSLQNLMGYNRFQYDPMSLNDSCNAISCRADLEPNPMYRYPFGAIDNKVSSVQNSRRNQRDRDGLYHPLIFARLGPTTNDQQPFCWSRFDSKRNIRGKRFSHNGQPECFDYHWQQLPLADR